MKEHFVVSPNLPNSKVTLLLLSGEYPQFGRKLCQMEIRTILTQPSENLPFPVRYHSDMQCCYLGNGRAVIAAGESELRQQLNYFDIQTILTESQPDKEYPRDAGCNVLQIEERLFCNPKSTDNIILREMEQNKISMYRVSQGYSRCSVAVIDANSVITADPGMAKIMKQAGLEVLEIQPGHIRLPGYDYGFIGGCCGLTAADQLAFTGSLKFHPDGERIKQFLLQCGVSCVELTNEPLLDIGGLIPIKERSE